MKNKQIEYLVSVILAFIFVYIAGFFLLLLDMFENNLLLIILVILNIIFSICSLIYSIIIWNKFLKNET